jgi:trigger factor
MGLKLEAKVSLKNQSEKTFEFVLGYDEVKNDLENAIKREAKKVQMDGFRKGKVPVELVKKRFGYAIELDECEKIANKIYQNYVKENNIKGLSTPILTDLNYEQGKELKFTIDLEVMPELENLVYKGLDIEKVVMPVTDEMVEEEIKRIAKSNAKLEDAEVIEGLNYSVSYDMVNSETPDAKPISLPAVLEELPEDNKLRELSQGKKKGDTFEFEFVDKHEHKHEDGTTEEHNHEYKFNVTVKDIKKVVGPTFDEEFVKKITGGKLSSLDELKKDIKEQLTKIYENQAENATEDNIIRAIIEKNPFEYPKRYADELLELLVNQDKENSKYYQMPFNEKESRERNKKNAEIYAKWFILRELIIKAEGLTLSDEEIEEKAKEYSEKYSVALDKAKELFNQSDRKERLLFDKLFDFLKQNNNMIEKVVKE